MPPKQDIHHVSFHFGKSKVLFSVPGSTTLAQLKLTLLSALPHLYPSAAASSSDLPGLDAEDLAMMDIPGPSSKTSNPDLPERVRYTREFCLWKARTGEDGELLSYVSLEGDVEDFDPLENMPGGGAASSDNDNNSGNGKGKGKSVESNGGEGTLGLGADDGSDGAGGGGQETGERRVALGKRINSLTNPMWERWVEVYVSFVEPDGTFEPPKIDKPALFDEEHGETENVETEPNGSGGVLT